MDMNFDDWRDETKLRLDKSLIYEQLKRRCGADSSGSHIMALVDDAVFYAYHRTKTVLKYMEEFTLHDGEHLFRVLRLMELLMTAKVIGELSTPELMLLILTAFFHDIGMAPSESDIRSWLADWEGNKPTEKETQEHERFERFCEGRPGNITQIEHLQKVGDHAKANIIQKYLVSEYIRITHADRAKQIIAEDWKGKVRYKDVDLTVEFAQLCFSHDQDALALSEMDKSLLCGQDTYICLPFIGVILRLADILDFDSKRTPSVLFSHLAVRHPISIQEWKKHRAVDAWTIAPNRISFQAKCEHPAIEATIRKFCDLIDIELITCNTVLANLEDEYRKPFPEHYKIKLVPRVDRSRIAAKKDIYGKPTYKYRDTQFTLDKRQVIDLLMGTKLYGDPSVALRELLQNSIDACLVRQALEKSWGNLYEPQITVKFYSSNGYDYLQVVDNGVGMDQEIIDKYYSQIGVSYYNSSDFYDLKAKTKMEFTPAARFGIGILSTFMVSDSLTVDTRRLYGPHDSSEPLKIIVEGHDSVFWVKDGERKQPGTTTELILHETHPWRGLNDAQVVNFVRKIVPNPPFEIAIETDKEKNTHSKSDFLRLSPRELDEYKWRSDENIKEIEFDIYEPEYPLTGKCLIGILEKNGRPTKSIKIKSKEVVIDNDKYDLSLEINMGVNEIEKTFDSIGLDDEGDIKKDTSYSVLAKSMSRISLYGIEIPMTLFPTYWVTKQNVRLDWPFPMVLILDIGNKIDLDLNSARTEITYNEKWLEFEEILSATVCKGIAKKVRPKYWGMLKNLFVSNAKSDAFKNGLKKV